MNFTTKVSRRGVLRAGFAVSGYSVLGSRLMAGGRPASRSDKLNVAFIGIGGYGVYAIRALESQNIVALCDVDWRTRTSPFFRNDTAPAVAARHPKAKVFNDWRVMLEKMEKQIDGVCISTADHTHAVAALTAMKMGKHVLCEKPLAHNVDEVRAMMEAERKYSPLATQTGIQGHVSQDRRMISEWIRAGQLGRIKEIHLFQAPFRPPAGAHFHISPRPPRYSLLKQIDDKIPIPSQVKWDLWLGPAPYRPYNPMYLPHTWRPWIDFGTGILGDHGPHFFDAVFDALDLGFPETVQALTDAAYNPVTDGKQLYPVRSTVRFRFPAHDGRPYVPVTWYGNQAPSIPKGWWKSKSEFPNGGGVIYGTKGTLVHGPMYMGKPNEMVPELVTLIPKELDEEYHKQPMLKPWKNLWMQWADRAREGRQGSADFQYGGVITQICLLGDIAIRHKGQILRFNSHSGQFANSESANRMFQRTYRHGWALPKI